MYILLLYILTKKLNATVICLPFLIGVYELTDVYASFIHKGLQSVRFVRSFPSSFESNYNVIVLSIN